MHFRTCDLMCLFCRPGAKKFDGPPLRRHRVPAWEGEYILQGLIAPLSSAREPIFTSLKLGAVKK